MRYEQDIEQQILADNQSRSNQFLRDFMSRHRGTMMHEADDASLGELPTSSDRDEAR